MGPVTATDAPVASLLTGIDADAQPGQLIQLVLLSVREHLGLDLAWVSEFTGGQRVFRFCDGAAQSFGVEIDGGDPLEETYCYRVVAGLLPNVIADARGLVETRDLDVTARRGIGAYVGIPIVLSDARVYGTFCCLGADAAPHLSERDVAFMRVAATIVAEQLERDELARRDHTRLREQIRAIIDHRGIEPAFQPIFDLTDRRVLGYEALSRFPGTANPSPAWWFDTAWAVQLGAEFELAAARAALDHLARLPAGTYMSCNFSPASLLDDGVLEHLIEVGDERLVIEVTEHAPVAQFDLLQERLVRLRQQGIRVALDDVGTGYATLSVLVELRPEIHKLDIELVRGVADDQVRRALVAGLAVFADTIGATAVAEGIETDADLAVLRELGVAAGQGYHLARPGSLPSSD